MSGKHLAEKNLPVWRRFVTGLRKSLGLRLVAMLILVCMTSIAATALLLSLELNRDLSTEYRKAREEMTRIFAGNVAGAVRWRKADVIERAFESFLSGPLQIEVAAIVSLPPKGTAITQYPKSGSLTDALALAWSTDQVRLLVDGTLPAFKNILVTYAPAGSDSEGDPQGYVLIAWKTTGVNEVARGIIGSALGISALGFLVVLVAMTWFTLREVSKPLSTLAERLGKVSSGDFESAVPHVAKSDEIGLIAHGITTLCAAERDRVRLEAERARLSAERERIEAARQMLAEEQATAVKALADAIRQVASGNMTARVDQSLAGDYQQLKDDFNSAIAVVEQTIASFMSGAHGIRLISNEIAQAADDLSRRTQSQAVSLEETVASVGSIAETVRRTADGAEQARGVVSAAKNEAEKGGQIVQKAIGAMSAIEKSSREINQIISVIDEIAFQTNLLALNAGVEAARAGDAGRGFAVVATEVRALAERAANAAGQIKSLISTSTVQVDRGVKLVAETGSALQRIAGGVTQINAVVSEIAAGANEQAVGLQQVSKAVNLMDQVTQQNAAMVEEASAATRSLAEQTDDLANLAARFKTGSGPRKEQVLRSALEKAVPHAFAGGGNEPKRAQQTRGRIQTKRAALAPGHSADGWEEF